MADKRKGRTENLVSIGELTTDKQREVTSKGGKASVAARRERKQAKETAELLLSCPVPDIEASEILQKLGLPENEVTMQACMIAGLILSACQGNARAALLVLGLIGEAPDENVNVTVNTNAEAIKQFESLADEYRKEGNDGS